MRSVAIIACSAVLAASGCSHVEVVRPRLTATAMHLAMPVDTGFVRSTCAEPDSVLAGTIPCYERSQKTHSRIF